jgi:hypothetical protein
MEGGVLSPLHMDSQFNIPLCFYVNGNDFKTGEFAKNRIHLNDKNTFDDYFELIKDPTKFFILHGDSKPVKQLLYYGIENYLSHFIKTILFKNESIEGLRTSFCLRFWFDVDIENQEKIFVENLFKEAGYENVAEVNSNIILNKDISLEIKSYRPRLCLTAISNDLYVQLYNSPDFSLVCQIKLDQLGSDPHAKILAKLISEDIKEASPHISIEEEKEIAHLINHCVQLLSNLTPIIRTEIALSNGVKAEYKIRLSDLEERLMYNRGIEDKVIPQLESILSSNGMSSSIIDIVLYGDELNTIYFKDRLSKKFPYVFGLASSFETKYLKSIFSDISSSGYNLKTTITAGRIEHAENTGSLTTRQIGIITPPVVKTELSLKTSPVVKTPPVVKAPPIPIKKDIITTLTNTNNKPEVKLPPIIKPDVKVPPVIKEEKKVEIPIPPPLKGKIPPPPPPLPTKKK